MQLQWLRAAEPGTSFRNAEPLGAVLRSPHRQLPREHGCALGAGAVVRAASSSCAPAGRSCGRGTEADLSRPPREQLASCSGSGPTGFEADCPSPWLRTWVEFQVDARINQALRDLAEGELFAGCRPAAAPHEEQSLRDTATVERASEVAAEAERLCRHLEEEVRIVSQAQARILEVINGLSGKVDKFGGESDCPSAEADGRRLFISGLPQEAPGGDRAAMDHMELRISEVRDEVSQRQNQCSDKLASALDVLAGTQREVGMLAQAFDRLDFRVSEREAAAGAAADRRVDAASEAAADRHTTFQAESTQISSLGSEVGVLREAQGRLEARLERLDRDVSSSHQGRKDLESRFEGLRTDLAGAVVTREELRQGIEELATEVADALATTKEELLQSSPQVQATSSSTTALPNVRALEQLVEESQQGLVEKVEAWQALLDKEVASQRKSMNDLNADVRLAMKGEDAAVVKLDEQLWLTDQRLGQRLDELDQRIANMVGVLEEREEKGQRTDVGAGPSSPPAPAYATTAALAGDASFPEQIQETPAFRRVHLGASLGRRNPRELSSYDDGYEASSRAGAVRETLVAPHVEVHTEDVRLLEAEAAPEPGPAATISSPPSTERGERRGGALSAVSLRQRLRIGKVGYGISDALATAAEALSGGDEEERRQLERLARLERVQDRAVSPAGALHTSTSADEDLEDLSSGPRMDTHRPDAWRRASPASSPTESTDAVTPSGAPSALTTAMARMARRRGPFMGGSAARGTRSPS